MMINIVQGLMIHHNIYYQWNFSIFYDFLDSCILKNAESIDIEVEYKNITNSIEVDYNTYNVI